MRKSIKFRDSSILNLILFFSLLNFLTDRDKIKQTNCILTLFHNTLNRMERTS